MKTIFRRRSRHRDVRCGGGSRSPEKTPTSMWSRSRFRLYSLGAGVCALIWLLLRTGTKPSRLSYPCQQSAFCTAATAFGAPLVAALLAGRAGLLAFMRTGGGKVAGGLLATLALVLFATASYDTTPLAAMLPPPTDYHPDVYLINDARGPEPETAPQRFGGVDDLVTLMGVTGFKWHRSPTAGLSSGPEGLIDRDDVIVIKVNGQWTERGGTNTDVLRGVIRNIVEHPDGFVGEVVVADNTQDFMDSLDHFENNAEDHSQSIQDVVDEFFDEGWTASTQRFDEFRSTLVSEYDEGDLNDGYVLNPAADPETDIIVSYPKFVTFNGAFVSYKYGVWNQTAGTYEKDRLVVINMPVLKTHMYYCVTGAVKNHMGVVTNALGTNSHNSVGDGGMGSFLAEVRMPDLTILDCIWVLGRPGSGPWAYYENTSRRDQLVASTDPVALDVWSVKHILMPQIIANGYGVEDWGDTQNPDNPASGFRRYLDLSMNEMLVAGIDTTNDYSAVDLHVWAGDADRDGDLDLEDYPDLLDCFTGPGEAIDPLCASYDFDQDGKLDLADVGGFQAHFTGP